ncbi:hypothetical protein GEV29_07295 [Aeromicrobium sp. SMF47]|uniref:Uncharacterized protein n=1 Tax=Aeromicrobium yanjiei TaxID=2662028 RepID=A0A5Q2MH51_9ACTN|nr:DUF6350 family protein [Aeromicrobium yanjiei]MRJ76337.1 hypothetical protein [Aeromicrobium yanjiei]QGG42484.1 hypothetical protein GEV26_14485 [Aeromicrobium yanjiei]
MPEPAESSFLRPAFLTALVAALVSIGVSAVLVLLARGASDLSLVSFGRASVRTWLVSMGSGIEAGAVSVGLVPLGATLVCLVIVAAVAAWIVAEPLHDLVAFAASSAGAYGVIAGVASTVTNAGEVDISTTRAALAAFVVGGLGAALGSAVRHRDAERWWFTSSEDVRAVIRAAVPGIAAVLVSATAVVAVLLVRGVARAGDLWALLDPGPGGGVALGVGSLLAVPTLILWTTSVLLGPGFALGTDTSVDLSGAQLGQVPGFPVLAGLPAPGQFPDWVFVLGLVPLLAGALCGWRLLPGAREGVLARVALGAAAGALAGLVLGVLVALSGGAIGPGRMADAGPPALTPLLVAVPVMAVGGAIGAALNHYRGGRAPRPSDTSATGRPRLWQRDEPAGADRRVH